MPAAAIDYCDYHRGRGGGGDNLPEGVVYDNIRDLKPETKPYYQVLIDNRDFPYMVSTHQCHLWVLLESPLLVYSHVMQIVLPSPSSALILKV